MTSIERRKVTHRDSLEIRDEVQLSVQVILDEPVRVAIALLKIADYPRIDGENRQHIRMLADLEVHLPPIIVHRSTMQVIDGVHRLRAAELRGDVDIEVSFFDGDISDVFAIAVGANVGHGLPLSSADRTAAAVRLLNTNPDWSDRSLAELTGLSAKKIAKLRRCTDVSLQGNSRRGRDGKIRPLDGGVGRSRAIELIAKMPNASLREIANSAGVSPATVRDVRARLERGDDPIPDKIRENQRKGIITNSKVEPGEILNILRKDPSLRLTESGRVLLRLLSWPTFEAYAQEELVSVVPPHCINLVAKIVQDRAASWKKFADQLTMRNQEGAL